MEGVQQVSHRCIHLTPRTRAGKNTLHCRGTIWFLVKIDKPACFNGDESMLVTDLEDFSDQRGYLQWVRVSGDKDFTWRDAVEVVDLEGVEADA